MNDQEESFDEKPTMSGGIQNKVFREMSFVNYMTTISSNEKGQILNMIQYGGLSILPLLLILKLMKFYIPVDDPLKSSSEILIEVVLQLVVIIVAFFFIHKLILYIPTYSTMEYEKVNLLTVLLPVFFLMFTLDTKISEKLNILLDRVLISTGLKKEGMDHEEDDLGPVYGHQWRHFNAHYGTCNDNYQDQGVDQLQRVLNDLKNPETRSSRRHVVSAWNPCQLNEMALPPCHVLFQFHVTQNNKLSCTLYQRSGDVGLGVPFNIMSYAAFTILVAKHCDLEPYEFIYYLGNTHIYTDHKDALQKQILRDPFEFPTMTIREKRDNINDYVLDDFIVENYQYHAPLKMNMSQ